MRHSIEGAKTAFPTGFETFVSPFTLLLENRQCHMCTEFDLHPLLRNLDLSSLPIGLYAVTPEGCFVSCNEHARRLLQLPLHGPISQKIGDFYADPEERARALTHVLRAEAEGSFAKKQVLHFKVNGRDVYVQNNCRSLRDPQSNEIIGFTGSLVDITEEHEYALVNKTLHQRVADLTTDIGRVLHANSSTLVMVHQALDTAIGALGPSPFSHEGLPSGDEIDAALKVPARELAQALSRLAGSADAEKKLEALPEVAWHELEDQRALLQDFKRHIVVQESRANTLRVVAQRMRDLSERASAQKLPFEAWQEVRAAAAKLERATALVSALNARAAVIQMDYTIRSLREFIITEVRRTEQKHRVSLQHLLESAHKLLAEFAECSRVKIRFSPVPPEAAVFGVERDLVRALANLLHNSIKYSWHRDRGEAPWVKVHTSRQEGMLIVAFENWGVPISTEEIQNNLIFKLGYRGQWSKDRGRLGTGIGLTDSLDVAQKHGGTVQVESRPSRTRWSLTPDNEEYFQQPFITTVTISLPEATQ